MISKTNFAKTHLYKLDISQYFVSLMIQLIVGYENADIVFYFDCF